MYKSVVTSVFLLLGGGFAMSVNEAMAYNVGINVCYYHCSIDCKLDAKGLKGKEVKEGNVDVTCKTGEGYVFGGHANCVNPQQNDVQPGRAGSKFDQTDTVGEEDIYKSGRYIVTLSQYNNVSELLGEAPLVCNDIFCKYGEEGNECIYPTDKYDFGYQQCLARLWGFEDEFVNGLVCNNMWFLDSVEMWDACWYGAIIESGEVVDYEWVRCTDSQRQGGFVSCIPDPACDDL
jgi:hypothetical protein